MNQAILVGNLTKDPEARTTPSNKTVTTASLATNKTIVTANNEKRKETQFHNLVIWGKRGEVFAQYLRKGSKVLVEGEIRYREYEDKDKIKRKIAEILVDEFEFLDSMKKEQTVASTPNYPEPEIDVSNIPFD